MQLGRLVTIALGLCVVALVVTAIADKGKSEPATAAQAAKASGSAKAVKQAAVKKPFHGRTVYVTMQGLAFSPRTIHIRIGDRVVWRNRDNVVHNVTTVEDPAGVNLVGLASPTIKPGGAYAYVAHYAGNAVYVCTIHPTTMRARIAVSKQA
jgi:plastocyanin